MPEISRFLGIVITMYHSDHGVPHFHARYNEFKGVFSINELQLIEGKLPNKIVSIVHEWAKEHQKELRNDWELSADNKPLNKIKPLV